jgi:phytoene dehydrogenase-like protein
VKTKSWDAIVIGAGHNGLITANYLADAGLKTLVLERRELVGGATVTEELIPGYRMSSCSYVSGLLHPVILKDLQLSSFGLDLYQTDMGTSSILEDGRHIHLYRELAKALKEIERVSPGASDGFLQFGLRLERFAQITREIILSSEPPSMSTVMQIFEESGEARLFDEFFNLSIRDLLDRYVSSDILSGLMTFLGVVSVYGGPSTPGWSFVYGHHAIGEVNGQMGAFAFARGGMGSIAEALAARARSKGVEILTNSAVASVIVERGAARGVVLADGTELRANIVASNADPVTTYRHLTDPKALPDDFVKAISTFDTRGSMARVFLAVDKLPQFIGSSTGEGPEHRGLTLLGAETSAFERAADAQRDGVLPTRFPIEFIIQTVHDPAMGPAGKHLISTGIQQLPYELAGGTWDDYRDEFTASVVKRLDDFSPGLSSTVEATYTITPLDLEREYGMAGGNIFHGALSAGQLFGSRPVPGVGSYRSPIRGLYLCGSGAHPGGGVIGAPGRNAAYAIIADRAAGGWTPQRSSSTSLRVGGAPLAHRVMQHPQLGKLGLWAARQEALAPVVRLLTKRRG